MLARSASGFYETGVQDARRECAERTGFQRKGFHWKSGSGGKGYHDRPGAHRPATRRRIRSLPPGAPAALQTRFYPQNLHALRSGAGKEGLAKSWTLRGALRLFPGAGPVPFSPRRADALPPPCDTLAGTKSSAGNGRHALRTACRASCPCSLENR